MSIVVGIDPGVTGAICVLSPTGARVRDLPARADGPNGRRIDVMALANLLRQLLPVDVPVLVFIEALAHGGMGKGRTNASTVDSQTWTQAAIVTTVELLGLDVAEHVAPAKWKKLYGLGGKAAEKAAQTQREVRELAVGLYPELADDLQRQADHNRAEAALIAHWGRKVRA